MVNNQAIAYFRLKFSSRKIFTAFFRKAIISRRFHTESRLPQNARSKAIQIPICKHNIFKFKRIMECLFVYFILIFSILVYSVCALRRPFAHDSHSHIKWNDLNASRCTHFIAYIGVCHVPRPHPMRRTRCEYFLGETNWIRSNSLQRNKYVSFSFYGVFSRKRLECVRVRACVTNIAAYHFVQCGFHFENYRIIRRTPRIHTCELVCLLIMRIHMISIHSHARWH